MQIKQEEKGRSARWSWKWLSCWLVAAFSPLAPATAELTVSQLIIELKPDVQSTADIEIFNNSPERSFVAVEPREMLDAGSPDERPFASPDPEKLGIVASPARLILEPNQRRTLRIAAIVPDVVRERVYRITVKPVAGDIESDQTGLKLLVGYDLLVLLRPNVISAGLTAARKGDELTLVNKSNASIELSEGKQCDRAGTNCRPLPSKRLYAGASWRQPLPSATMGEYRARTASGWSTLKF